MGDLTFCSSFEKSQRKCVETDSRCDSTLGKYLSLDVSYCHDCHPWMWIPFGWQVVVRRCQISWTCSTDLARSAYYMYLFIKTKSEYCGHFFHPYDCVIETVDHFPRTVYKKSIQLDKICKFESKWKDLGLSQIQFPSKVCDFFLHFLASLGLFSLIWRITIQDPGTYRKESQDQLLELH